MISTRHSGQSLSPTSLTAVRGSKRSCRDDAGPEQKSDAEPVLASGGDEAPCRPVCGPAAFPDPLSVSTSYVILRNGIGTLGLALPFVLIGGVGLDHVQGSLSAYYHYSPATPLAYGSGTMRDVFVGMLCSIGAFLLFYRGHSVGEDIALNIAGVSAVLIALFPMDWPAGALVASTSSKVHSASATVFFLMIAYVCIFCAHHTLWMIEEPDRRRAFKRIYVLLGILMVATPAVVALLSVLMPRAGHSRAILLVEVGGVLVFASFWLIKGLEIRAALRRK